jgi:integral membrane sensor domain MASE1
MAAAPSEDRRSEFVWDFMRLELGRRVSSLAAFGLLYAALMLLGLALRESSQQLTFIWPSAGLLFMALWFSPRRNWIWILAVQIAVEIAIDSARYGALARHGYAPFVLANSLDGIVGALVAKRLMTSPEIPRIRHVLRFFAAAGEMTVDTAPGRGCRVSVVFPHNEIHPLLQQRDSGNNRSTAT